MHGLEMMGKAQCVHGLGEMVGNAAVACRSDVVERGGKETDTPDANGWQDAQVGL